MVQREPRVVIPGFTCTGKYWHNWDLVPDPKIMPSTMYTWASRRQDCWDWGSSLIMNVLEALVPG